MTETDVFQIVPAIDRWHWFWLILVFTVVLVVLAVGAAIYSVWAAKKTWVELGPVSMRIHSGFYSRTVALSDLLLEQARVLDLNEERQFRPSIRTNGIGMPGLQAGWFRLKNKEKALVFVSDRSRVAYLPTRKGYSLMFSLESPVVFLERLGAH